MTCYGAEKKGLESSDKEPESAKAKVLTGYGTEEEESKTSNRELNRKRGRRKKNAMRCRAERGRT